MGPPSDTWSANALLADAAVREGLGELWATLLRRLRAWRCDGLQLEIQEEEAVRTAGLTLLGTVLDPAGRRAGTFNGHLLATADLENSTIVLNQIHLYPASRGRDFSRRLLSEIEACLSALGYRHLQVHAVGIGAYIWAGCGFRFAVPREAAAREAFEVIARAEAAGAVGLIRCHDRLAAPLEDLLSRITRRPDRTNEHRHVISAPGDFIAFTGEVNGAEAAERREVVRTLLAASHWHGMKDLASDQSSTPAPASARPQALRSLP